MEATQLSINKWTDKQNVVHTYNTKKEMATYSIILA